MKTDIVVLFLVLTAAVAVVGAVLCESEIIRLNEDVNGDYHEVMYDYGLDYRWSTGVDYYIITFNADNDGYVRMYIQSPSAKDALYLEMFYHKGFNQLLVNKDETFVQPYNLTFYER